METAPVSVIIPRRAGIIAISHDGTLRIGLSNIDAQEFNVAFEQMITGCILVE